MAANNKATASQIRVALRDRFPKQSHALLFEVANGTGARARRYADAVAMGLWPSHGLEVDGIEIKVSRSDWLRELKDHRKSDEIARYCHRWWVAAPKGLIQPDELPGPWGLLELHDGGSLRQKVAAPRQEPSDLDRAFVASMLRRAAEAHHADVDLLVEKRVANLRRDLEQRYVESARREANFRVQRAEEAMKKVEQVKEAIGIDLTAYTPTDNVIRAIKFADRFLGQYGAIASIERGAKELLAGIEALGGE